MKERLTKRTKGLKDEECVDLFTPQGWYTSSICGELTKKALERLADYEDIGTVEELMALKEQNEALKRQLGNSAQLIKYYKHIYDKQTIQTAVLPEILIINGIKYKREDTI